MIRARELGMCVKKKQRGPRLALLPENGPRMLLGPSAKTVCVVLGACFCFPTSECKHVCQGTVLG